MIKIKLILSALLLSFTSFGQTPSVILRLANSTTAIGQNTPAGTILSDMDSKKRYLVLLPLVSTQTIDNCIKLLLDNEHTSTGVSKTLAQIKEIGTNTMSHYIGEVITTDGAELTGIVIAVWSNAGVEKVLLVKEFDENASGTSSIKDYVVPVDITAWRVPSIYELNCIYNSILIINSILGTDPPGGLQLARYWSSTAVGSNNYYKDFSTGAGNNIVNTTLYRKRLVRTHF